MKIKMCAEYPKALSKLLYLPRVANICNSNDLRTLTLNYML